MKRKLWAVAAAVAPLLICACGSQPKAAAPKAEAPAKLSGAPVKESELAHLTLTAEAVARLGIRTARAGTGTAGQLRRFAGDLMVPPGKTVVVAAAVAGTVRASGVALPAVGAVVARDQVLLTVAPLLPLPRDLRVTAEADLDQAKTRLETAKLRMARADRLVKDEVGTVRGQEEARNELETARSAVAAAQARVEQIRRAPLEGDVELTVRAPLAGMLRQLMVAPGQVVNGGAPLFEVVDLKTLWIRVPVYGGEASGVVSGTAVTVESLSGERVGTAEPVQAPPTGDPAAATVDFYYALENANRRFRPGERVRVVMRGRAQRTMLQVPWPAIVFDTQGGTWLYEQLGERRFARRRVELDHTAGGVAYLRGGIPPGTTVVVDGVAELWGTEFGSGK